jgi:tetratricopeptide (TPR) repeat protein
MQSPPSGSRRPELELNTLSDAEKEALARQLVPPPPAQVKHKPKLAPVPVAALPAEPVPRDPMEWVLWALAGAGCGLLLLLPTVAAAMLASIKSAAIANHQPMNLTARTAVFFMGAFGVWAFIVFVWSCIQLCIAKGRTWAWGLLSLPGAAGLLGLATFGDAAWGLLAVMGLGGIIAPICLPPKHAGPSAKARAAKISILSRLAGHVVWVWALGLFVGVCWSYANSFQGGMTLDNKYIIEEYFHQVPRLIGTEAVGKWTVMAPIFFKTDYWWPKGISGLYRPLAVMSYWFNYVHNQSVGNAPLDPFQYHVVNLILHWLAACLAFVLIRQLTGRVWIAFFSALLFATHPIATESVSNIIGRSDIFAAIATFGCLTLYIGGTRSTPLLDPKDESPWSSVPWIICFAGAEAIVVALLVLNQMLEGPAWLTVVAGLLLAIVPALGAVITYLAMRMRWTQLPWLAAFVLVLTLGLFAKESAIAVAGIIVMYDVVYRWTLEELRRAVPSLLALSVLAAIAASAGLWVGHFEALGLSEGLNAVLIILLLASLLSAAGLVAALMLWVLKKPLRFVDALEPWVKYFLPYATVFPPIVLWLFARGWVFQNSSPPETPFLDNPIRGLGFLAARMTASDVFIRLLSLLVWPIRLSCDYSYDQIPLFNGNPLSPETWVSVLGLLALLSMIGLAIYTYRRNKTICFLICFYLVAYLPTSNFLIIIGSIMAERFMYLPLIAFVACIVLGVDFLVEYLRRKCGDQLGQWTRDAHLRKTAGAVLICTLALAYGVRAWFRNDDWLSDVTLWTAAAKASPRSFRSYQSKAFALYEVFVQRESSGAYRNDPAAANADIDACYQTAENAKPIVDPLPLEQNSARLYLHLGMYYLAKGSIVGHFLPNGVIVPGDAGEQWFRRAEKVLQQGSIIDRAFNRLNRRKEKERKIHKLDEIPDVGLPPVYAQLGNAYARLGEWDKALRAFQYCCHLDSSKQNIDVYVQIANAYGNLNRPEDEAIALVQFLLLSDQPVGMQIWGPLNNALAAINPGRVPAVIGVQGRPPSLNTNLPLVRSVICSAFQRFAEIHLLEKHPQLAALDRDAAVNQWKFAPELFDNLVHDPDAESPVPPDPDP